MIGTIIRAAEVVTLAIGIVLIAAANASGQAAPTERTFSATEARVQKALHDLHAATSGHLPVLDGFVDTSEPLDHYERGFYQCTIQEIPAAGGGTTVRVSAKITAWYADPSGAHSGYRVLPSNGRIESDFLDSIGEALAGKSAAASLPAATAAPNSRGNSASEPAASATAGSATAKPSASGGSSGSAPASAGTASESTQPGALAGMTTEAIRAKREETERKVKDLTTQIQNFEQIRAGLSHPDDIAAVKKGGTPIYSSPEEKGEVLMTAETGDEFPIVDVQGAWVHVQISGPSRGWIRRAQLEMPAGFLDGVAKSPAGSDAVPLFRVTREDLSPFAGSWGPLKDKVVKILWVAPLDSAPAQTSAQAKRNYAKSLFLKAYREISTETAATAGVVIVFDSADGGQVAATLASVKLLATGKISDEVFWSQCSLDPPESFQDASKQ